MCAGLVRERQGGSPSPRVLVALNDFLVRGSVSTDKVFFGILRLVKACVDTRVAIEALRINRSVPRMGEAASMVISTKQQIYTFLFWTGGRGVTRVVADARTLATIIS